MPTPSKVNASGMKRKALEIQNSDENEEMEMESGFSLKDVMDKISEATKMQSQEFSTLRSDIATLRQDINSQIESIKHKVSNVEGTIENINSRIDGFDNKIVEIAETTILHGKEINRMMQEKLECHMEIAGLNHEVIEENADVLELAIRTIASQGIAIEKDDIVRASKKIFNIKGKDGKQYKKGILNVVFKVFDKKIQVMKQKRQCTTETNKSIYFNISLTSFNRHFMTQAKEITKGKLKVYFGRGNVRVVKKDNTEIVVDDLCKFDDLREYMLTINETN